MTPLEFKTLRQSLGLVAEDVARHMKVGLRTAQRWESTITPPLDAVEWLESLQGEYADRVAEVLDSAENMGGSVALIGYRDPEHCAANTGMTLAQHTALLGHVIMACIIEDVEWEIVDVDGAHT